MREKIHLVCKKKFFVKTSSRKAKLGIKQRAFDNWTWFAIMTSNFQIIVTSFFRNKKKTVVIVK